MNPEHDQLEISGRTGPSAQRSQAMDARRAVDSERGCHRLLSDDVLQHADELVLGGAAKAAPVNGWGTPSADLNSTQAYSALNDRPSQGHARPVVLKPVKVSLLVVGAGILLAFAVFSAYMAFAAYEMRKSRTMRNSRLPRTSRTEQQRRQGLFDQQHW
jgi:hypothetical protein